MIDGVRPPDFLQDDSMREDAARIPREQRQQREFFRRQPDLLAAANRAVQVVVDGQVAEPRLAALALVLRVLPAERDADAREQLLRAEGLRDVVVGALIERRDL